MLGVASDRPACLYGWSVGFGPWAHGMALACACPDECRLPFAVMLRYLFWKNHLARDTGPVDAAWLVLVLMKVVFLLLLC